MKIKFESQKTSLRLSKDEFSTLRNYSSIKEETILPDGKTLQFLVELDNDQYFHFNDDKFHFVLPNHLIHAYTPRKEGLCFKFQCGDGTSHTVVFEIDIKKPPLGHS